MRLSNYLIILLLLSCAFQKSEAHPIATDRAERWQLDLSTGDLRFYRDLETGVGYWLLVYEVENSTGEDRRWVPQFDLVTDKGEIISEGDNVSRAVQLHVLDIFGDPLMKTQSDASGPILQGEENAIRSIAIWKANNEDVRQVQVFASGASGDTAEVEHPITGEKKKLHRVVQLSWTVDGGVDQLILKPLPVRPVSSGTSVRDLTASSKGLISGTNVSRKWIFR